MLTRFILLSGASIIGMASAATITLSVPRGDGEINGLNVHGTSFIITENPTRYTIESETDMTEVMQLNSITLNNVYMYNAGETEFVDTYPVYLYIINKNDQLLGISSLANIKAFKKDADILDSQIEDYTFSFDSSILLTKDREYTILFKSANDAYDASTNEVNYYTALRFLNSRQFQSELEGEQSEWGLTDQFGNLLSGYQGWGYAMSIELSPTLTVPEPGTSALFLIALEISNLRRKR